MKFLILIISLLFFLKSRSKYSFNTNFRQTVYFAVESLLNNPDLLAQKRVAKFLNDLHFNGEKKHCSDSKSLNLILSFPNFESRSFNDINEAIEWRYSYGLESADHEILAILLNKDVALQSMICNSLAILLSENQLADIMAFAYLKKKRKLYLIYSKMTKSQLLKLHLLLMRRVRTGQDKVKKSGKEMYKARDEDIGESILIRSLKVFTTKLGELSECIIYFLEDSSERLTLENYIKQG